MWTLWIFTILSASLIASGLNYLVVYPAYKDSSNRPVTELKRIGLAVLIGMIPLTFGLFVSMLMVANNFPCGVSQ